MLRSGDGVPTDSAVLDITASIKKVTARALEQFSRERNALVRMNRLPSELFLLIASFLPYRALERATTVCHRWHELLCADASLWDSVAMSFERSLNIPALQTALARGRQTCRDLSIRWYYCSSECAPLSKVIATALEHLTDLRLSLPAQCCDAWHSILTSPAPALRTLEVTAPPGDPLRLPDDLFGGSAPELWCVWLTNALLPRSPGAALRNVSDVAYFAIDLMTTAEAAHIFAVCPGLQWLTVTAHRYDVAPAPPGFVPPRLHGIGVAGLVPDGLWETLVRAQPATSALRWLTPEGELSVLVFAQMAPIAHVELFVMGYPAHTATLVMTGTDGRTTSLEQVSVFKILDVLVQARDRLAAVQTLAVSDSVLLMLSVSGVLQAFERLQALTVLLRNEPDSPCRHMFDGDDAPYLDCASLETVRLASWFQYADGYDPENDIIELSSDIVGRWLPKSTRKLLLCGVRLDSGRGFDCEVSSEWTDPRSDSAPTLHWPWWCSFPSWKAVRV